MKVINVLQSVSLQSIRELQACGYTVIVLSVYGNIVVPNERS